MADINEIKKTLILSEEDSPLIFWNFEEDKIFKGVYVSDYEPNGRLNGYIFKSDDGKNYIINNHYNITKALSATYKSKTVKDSGCLLEIEFVGRKQLTGGKSVMQYKIYILD